MAAGEIKRRREAAYRKGLEHGAAEVDRIRKLALHYMNALREVAIEDNIEAAQLIACKALGSNPSDQKAVGINDLIERSKAKLAAMSEEERQAMWQAQRESFVRAMTTPCEHGVLDFEQCPQCRRTSPVQSEVGSHELER